MGKGDKRTKKGKRIAGSYGNTRPRKAAKPAGAATTKTEASAAESTGTEG